MIKTEFTDATGFQVRNPQTVGQNQMVILKDNLMCHRHEKWSLEIDIERN